MKAASILGRYDDEWNEGVLLTKGAGEVPIMMLSRVLAR
jgi:hypothetical protein